MGNADSGFLQKEKGALSMQDQFDNFCKKRLPSEQIVGEYQKFFKTKKRNAF